MYKISDVTAEDMVRLHNEASEKANALAEEKGIDVTTPKGKKAIIEELGDALDMVVLARFIQSSPPLLVALTEMDLITYGRAMFRAGYLSGREHQALEAQVTTDA